MSTIFLNDLYKDTLLKLKEGKRPQIKLTPELIELLKREWQNSPHEVLCVLNHTEKECREFDQLIISALEKHTAPEFLIYLLAASEKHIINESIKSGNPPSHNYFLVLKKLLLNKNPEVLVWTLRTIEMMGPLSLRMKIEILETRPGIKRFFNSHLRASSEIINSLEEQWKKYL